MKDIHARIPINKTAARVVSAGEQYVPNKKHGSYLHSELPLPTRRIPSDAPDLRGIRFGSFRVVGLGEQGVGRRGNAPWVVRCDCGRYEHRTAKAIRNPRNTEDACNICRHTAFLKRRMAYLEAKREGREP